MGSSDREEGRKEGRKREEDHWTSHVSVCCEPRTAETFIKERMREK